VVAAGLGQASSGARPSGTPASRGAAHGHVQSYHAEPVLEAGPEWDGCAVGLEDFHDAGGTVVAEGGCYWGRYQGESWMLDSPEGVCPGQTGLEYPATFVPFSNKTTGTLGLFTRPL
jgi:hypothetical protein